MLNLVSLPLPYAGLMKPHLVLMAVYYWAIFRPTLVPPALCFALGLVMDSLAGLPLGMNAIVLVVVRWLVSDQRRFLMGQPYVTLWAVFGLVMVLSACLEWGLYGLKDMAWTPFPRMMIQAAVSICLFPFVTVLLIAVHRILPGSSR